MTLLGALVVAYLPGAALYRMQWGNRGARAALPADERAFWHVVISLTWSLLIVLTLAALGAYRYERLIGINLGVVTLGLGALAARGQLRYGSVAKRPGPTVLFAVILVALGVWRFFPAAEYVLGGKDPGVYVNEGIQLDRTGRMFRRDEVIAALPAESRDLFVPSHGNPLYYSLRFMGVYVNDPESGEVIGQFPHVFPASIALGYRLAGVNGATNTVGFWAVLGLLAVYFLGSHLFGRLPAFAACVVLSLNVVEVWFGRTPSAEMLMQVLIFSALLALARADEGDSFFGWVAGFLCVLAILLRFDSFIAMAAIACALVLRWIALGRRPHAGFAATVLLGSALAFVYFSGPMRQYFFIYRANLPSVWILIALGVALAGGVALAVRHRDWLGPIVQRFVPGLGIVGLVAFATSALFWRQEGGKLAEADAATLRTFRDAYFYWTALIAAIAGWVLAVRRDFWRGPVFFTVFAAFCLFFFYKNRIWPEQFWMARRFVPVILPGAMLLVSAAAFGLTPSEGRRRGWRVALGVLLMASIGSQYARAAAPVVAHREYEGAIVQTRGLAELFTPRDLVIVETRDTISGDFHILATPLAYVHDLNVLVLHEPRPDRQKFAAFLKTALARYNRVLFVTGGGSDFLSRGVIATPIAFRQLIVPEYETTDWRSVPDEVRRKDLGYTVFNLTLGEREPSGFDLDLGYQDDLHVVRFYAREIESSEGRTLRWTMGLPGQSVISATGLSGRERELILVMSSGGRPANAPPAEVEVFFNDVSIGRVQVGQGFREYRLRIAPELAEAAGASMAPAQIRIATTAWVPSESGPGSPDTRALGVMIDRLAIH